MHWAALITPSKQIQKNTNTPLICLPANSDCCQNSRGRRSETFLIKNFNIKIFHQLHYPVSADIVDNYISSAELPQMSDNLILIFFVLMVF